ncbi:MAG: winged helix-turn-helix transcriptional regulator, partial [Erythrobacter sp.]|nr:winged helix-turn-helix transcriptional regulator [Erythrobacter sp.]
EAARDGVDRPRLPEAAVLRKLIKARQLRMRFLDAELFADPAWDILLDLAAARAERQQVCVTSLCIAAGVPATTALRRIGQMVDADLLVRVSDPHDRRRAYIALADSTADALARYFAAVGATELAVV